MKVRACEAQGLERVLNTVWGRLQDAVKKAQK